jgi:hypothetical protein
MLLAFRAEVLCRGAEAAGVADAMFEAPISYYKVLGVNQILRPKNGSGVGTITGILRHLFKEGGHRKLCYS